MYKTYRKSKASYQVCGGAMALCYWALAFPSIVEPFGDPCWAYRVFQVLFHLVWGCGCYVVYVGNRYYADGKQSCWDEFFDAVIYGAWMGFAFPFLLSVIPALE